MANQRQRVRQRLAEINGLRLNEAIGDIKTNEQAQKVGREIASRCEWSGELILALAAAALEDANFHPEAETLRQMAKKL